MAALKRLKKAGIPTVVWLCPILPFINDNESNIKGILNLCREAGVYGIICFGMGLTLREGNREYFYKQLDRLFPGMKERYKRTFGEQYRIPSPNEAALMRLFHGFCEENNMIHDNNTIFHILQDFEEEKREKQISLWDLMK